MLTRIDRSGKRKPPTFPYEDLEAMLKAFGDDIKPLAETVRTLDDIVSEFIIETSAEAELRARYAGRAKTKVEDFQFALRKDPKKLGRMTELLSMDRTLKMKRKAFQIDETAIGKGEMTTAKRKRAKKGEEEEEEEEGPVRRSVEDVGFED
ncbi:TFIID-18kDa-domain-containing protein [Trichodelitschia bisporula]|uniref:Transcription initiation factor TFIID subunit 13 n=1 Tax=Trichodelitschia bisporula TaxID=703511 RepID=A0A6G1HU06_9PEZI|nr:TFIID-18kDa-domain-containing protein [Trichodelitschia bisporula]